jgi:hypothetical protein
VHRGGPAAVTEHEFFERLRREGVLVRLRGSTKKPGEITGYSVGLTCHTNQDGGVIWYGGGKLSADLTLAAEATPAVESAERAGAAVGSAPGHRCRAERGV